MKNTRAILMIGVSIVAALFAVILASRWVSQQGSANSKKLAVAAIDINLGTRLTPEMIRLADWPTDSVPSGSFIDLKTLDTRVTRVSLQRGEPLMEAKLAMPGATGGLSAVVAEGKRAMTVRVNDVVGVAGFALPGNFVDILVSTQGESKKPEHADLHISKLVLERILVLAVAQEASQNETKPTVVNAVTLEVTPEQAEKLDLARTVGQLSLVLRNQIDLKPALTDGATKQSLLNVPEVKPAQKPEVPVKEVKVKVAVVRTVAKPARREEQCQHIATSAGRITECQ